MPSIDESFIKLFGSSPKTFSPINTGAGRSSSDVVTATFNPRGASHVADENQKKAAQQAIIDEQNRKQAELAQQTELKRQQDAIAAQNAQIAQSQAAWDAQQAAPEPVAVAAPGPDPYASFYSLNSRQQKKFQRNPKVAARRGVTIPPAGYVPSQQQVATAASIPQQGARPELLAAPVVPAVAPASNQAWLDQYGATADRQATGWKDPIAMQVTKPYYLNLYGDDKEYNRLLRTAEEYQTGKYGGYLSPLDPMGMGDPKLQYEYIKAGGQAFSPSEMENNLKLTGNWVEGSLNPVVPNTGYVSQSYGNFMGTSGTGSKKGRLG